MLFKAINEFGFKDTTPFTKVNPVLFISGPAFYYLKKTNSALK